MDKQTVIKSFSCQSEFYITSVKAKAKEFSFHSGLQFARTLPLTVVDICGWVFLYWKYIDVTIKSPKWSRKLKEIAA
jgi:hypothetical protein